ncbi:TRAP transporter substrate-binding protein DctP, partial [Blautia pseudococcoides]|nr:TRAP transporter substrate-binding protein DctP [Blautia pseudococcoides]
MKRKLVCMCFGMAVFSMLLSGCGEDKSKKDTGDSGADVDTEAYDFSQDKSFDITAGGIQAAEDTVTLAMQKMADEVKEKSGGTITISVSPAAQLGDATSQMEAVS